MVTRKVRYLELRSPQDRIKSTPSSRPGSDGDRWFTPEEILHMDWLCDCVDGSIPPYEDLLPMSRSIVRLQGVYREAIPPEKEDTIL